MSGKDPKRYRANSVPHDSSDAANAALEAFYAGVEELRSKHRIAQVLITAQVNYALSETEETVAYGIYHIGDALHQEAMAAFAFGRSKQVREEVIEGTMARRRK